MKKIVTIISTILISVFVWALCGCADGTVTVTFEIGDGTQTTAQYNYDDNYGALPLPERAGYVFVGWYADEEYTMPIDAAAKITKNADHKLYARWASVHSDRKVSAGYDYSLALDESGRLYVWCGNNKWHKLGVPFTDGSSPVAVDTNVRFASVYAGYQASYAIDTSGGLWQWGYNAFHRLNDASPLEITSPRQIFCDMRFISFAQNPTSNTEAYAIADDGTLYRLTVDIDAPVQDEDNGLGMDKMCDGRFVYVTAGSSHALALDARGHLWSWGKNSYGQLGDGETLPLSECTEEPVSVLADRQFMSVAATTRCSLAIDADGDLWAWGDNTFGCMGVADVQSSLSPMRITSETKFAYVYAWGSSVSAIDADGGLWSWGINASHILGMESEQKTVYAPTRVTDDILFTDISVGASHSLAIDTESNYYAWGSNGSCQIGDGIPRYVLTPRAVNDGRTYNYVAAYGNTSYAIDENGDIYAIGENNGGDGLTPTPIVTGYRFVSLTVGDSHFLAIDENGGLWSWGSNDYGQLGIWSADDSDVPIRVNEGIKFKKAVIGGKRSYAIDENDRLWAWGKNNDGFLGVGDNKDRRIPVTIGDGNRYRDISAGDYQILAIDARGDLYGWGYPGGAFDGYGMKASPQLVVEGLDLISVAVTNCAFTGLADATYAYAVGRDGSLYCITSLYKGSKTYERKIDLPNALVSANVNADDHSITFTLKADDGAYWFLWSNQYGQWGNGTRIGPMWTPVEVTYEREFTKIAIGSEHTVAIDTDGNLYLWGSNEKEQCAYSNVYEYPRPTLIYLS